MLVSPVSRPVIGELFFDVESIPDSATAKHSAEPWFGIILTLTNRLRRYVP
jgi:hypothetical protein